MKLAVFSGQYFWSDGTRYSTDEAFVNFVTAFHPFFDKIVFCDAVPEGRARKPYVVDPAEAEVCPLPYFNVYGLWRDAIAVYPEIYRRLKENMPHWDVVWLHAPHPISLVFVYVCRKLNKPFFFFIRQNLGAYVGFRNSGLRRLLAVAAAMVLEHVFQRLARGTLAFAVGEEIFEKYSKRGARVRRATVSLVPDAEIGIPRKPVEEGSVRLLSVGRLDKEKGAIYLVRGVEELISRGRKDLILRIVGSGTEEKTLRAEVERRGLSEFVGFEGYIAHNDGLMDIYRESDIFVLPSLTEGWPQTLFEAMACGLAVVATRVGGIPHLIADGQHGLLVDPASPSQIGNAIERLIEDRELRNRLVANGLSLVRNHSLEAERDRIAGVIEGYLTATANCR